MALCSMHLWNSCQGRVLLWRTSLIMMSAMLALSMGRCQCSKPRSGMGSVPGEEQVVALPGTPREFTVYTRSAHARGQKVAVVGGIVGDLPGISDALDSLRSVPLAAGRLTIIPRANANAIRATERGNLSDAFGPEADPALHSLVTTLQAVADTHDVLIVVTDMVDDVGNSLLYSPEAPVATVSIAQQIAEGINRQLGLVARVTGNAFDEFYALRSGHPHSFIGWAGERGQPSLALELALFGGHEPDLPVTTQMTLARVATTVTLVELGILSRDALDDLIAITSSAKTGLSRSPTPDDRARAPVVSGPRFPDGPGLRYLLDGSPAVHVLGELWGLSAQGVLRLVGLHGGMFDGVTVDLVGLGDEDDVGDDVSLGRIPGSGVRIVEVRYRKDGHVIWKEPLVIGDTPRERMVLQDTLGTHPWVRGFPARESWLYLSTGRSSGYAACDLPTAVRLAGGAPSSVIGSNRVLRNYHLELDGKQIGELFVPRWRDTENTHLVDISEVNDRFGLSPGIIVEMRYATDDNFLGANVYDGMNRCLLKEEVAEALARVHRGLQAQGLGLKVWDCYRPHAIQYRMWQIKPESGYVAQPERGSNHNRGGAVDLTLVDARGRELDMPTEYDSFTERAWQATTEGLSARQLRNKTILREAMISQGFSPIRKEWWHYDGPNQERYTTNLDVPLGTGHERMAFPRAWGEVKVVER